MRIYHITAKLGTAATGGYLPPQSLGLFVAGSDREAMAEAKNLIGDIDKVNALIWFAEVWNGPEVGR